MTDPIAVLALRRKRDEISGVIAEYENKIKAGQHDLACCTALCIDSSNSPQRFQNGSCP